MASIKTHPASKYWYSCYRDLAGRQHTKSSKIEHSPEPDKWYDPQDPKAVKERERERARLKAVNKRLAQAHADGLEEAERGNPTEAHLRKLVAELSERIHSRTIEFPSVEQFIMDWLDKRNLSDGTRPRYDKAFKSFLDTLGDRRGLPINAIKPGDFNSFVQSRTKDGIAASTIVADLKALNVPFASALRQGIILSNPVAAADPVDGAMQSRKPFTPTEVESLLRISDADWQTAILFAAYAGLRLGDATNLTWGNVNLFEKTLTFRPKKNARKKVEMVIPLCDRLVNHLLTLPKGKDSDPVTPTLSGLTSAGKSGLSMRFDGIMDKAGIKQESIKATGKGRAFRAKTFHSLRHFFITQLEEAGVAPDIRQKLAGHSTDKAHSRYTHTEISTLRKAVANL